jgi:hypothetical protein
MFVSPNLKLAFRYYYRTETNNYYYKWLNKPSLDIAHYKCSNCYNIQNSTRACCVCNYKYPYISLCNGKNGHKYCKGCMQITTNRFAYFIQDIHYFSRKIQKMVRGHIARQKVKKNSKRLKSENKKLNDIFNLILIENHQINIKND